MFPTGCFKKILCPDEDECMRPHCSYFHKETPTRKNPWRRRKIKPWLDENSAVMTLVRYSTCPPQSSTVHLPPRPLTGPRTAFAPVVQPREGPAIFSQQSEVLLPPSHDLSYSIQNGYPGPSFAIPSQGFPGYCQMSQLTPSAMYDPNTSLYPTYMSSMGYSPASPEVATEMSIQLIQPKPEPIDPSEHYSNTLNPSSVTLTSASTSNETSINNFTQSTSDPSVLSKRIKQEVVEEKPTPDLEIIGVVKREVSSPEREPPPKKKKKDPLSLPLPKLPERKQSAPASTPITKGNVNTYLAEVARLDEEIRQIEELRQLQDRKKQLLLMAAQEEGQRNGVEHMESVEEVPIPMPAEDDDIIEEYTPTSSKHDRLVVKKEIPYDGGPRKIKKRPAGYDCGYTPTPIAELKKQKELKEELERKKRERADEKKREKEKEERLNREIEEREEQEKEEEEERKKKEKEARKRQKEKENEEIRKREKEALKRNKEKDERERDEAKERKRKEKERAKKLEAKQKSEDKRIKDLSDKKNKNRHEFVDDDMAVLFGEDIADTASSKKISERRASSDRHADPITARRLAEKKMAGVQKNAKLSEDQLAAAKRLARPMANVLPRVAQPNKPKSAQAQLAERMEKVERERQETLDKQKKEAAGLKARRLTEGEKYGGMGTSRASTIAKGDSRSSHTNNLPSTSSAGKPKLLDPTDFKIPASLRMKYLDLFYEACLKASGRANAAGNAAIEEKSVKDRSSTKQAYQVSAVHAIKRIRESGVNGKTTLVKSTVSHMAVMAGRHMDDISVGIKRAQKANMANMNEKEFYNILKNKYLMSKDDLLNNGYPFWTDGTHTEVTLKENEMDKGKNRKRFADEKDLNRLCSRCGAEFKLHPKGEVTNADCIYHFGRQWKRKVNGNWETRYNCCDTDITAPGCCVAKSHVSETLRKTDLKMFRELPSAMTSKDPRSTKVYALDCEMVYTVWGPALARVSVVDMEDDLALDVLVKPPGAIVDANTRFSGLTTDQLETVTDTIDDAYNRLSELMNTDTVLIGHSLESDLKSMHIVHKNVVDTSVVFPHRLGPPYKKALRTLAGDILQKIIQEDVDGHDSKEDSSACMQLMLHKVKSDKGLK